MRMMSIVGTRPNFMKVAPLVHAFSKYGSQVEHFLVHTGQHYDSAMSDSFFEDLGIPAPNYHLGVGSGSHAAQTAAVMAKIEPVMLETRPDIVIVVGDVNSTLAAAITAKKLELRVAHIESGLRSFDRTMPEEINRLCTDAISDLLFTTDSIANENLQREGIPLERIHFVGNVMIDSLMACLDRADLRAQHTRLGVKSGAYATLTLHRAANVDDPIKLTEILHAVHDALGGMPVLFPVHPRTRARIRQFGLEERFAATAGQPGIFMTDPMGYIDFLGLNHRAKLILTDSGGLQEEATILGVPCVTLRNNTERPITITQGTNRLGTTSRDGILAAIADALACASGQSVKRPEKWDGHAAVRIADILLATAA